MCLLDATINHQRAQTKSCIIILCEDNLRIVRITRKMNLLKAYSRMNTNMNLEEKKKRRQYLEREADKKKKKRVN